MVARLLPILQAVADHDLPQAMIDEHLAVDPLMLDAALEESLFADLPWRDPSPSGEFEAIHA